MKTNLITETDLDLQKIPAQETVYTIGNGYIGTRGTFEEGYPGRQAFTLLHGVFDDIPIVFTELVNIPNWLNLNLYADGERFWMDPDKIAGY